MASEAYPVAGIILVTGTEAAGGKRAVFRVDQATGAQSVLSSAGAFVAPGGLAVEANGSVVVADCDAFGGQGGVIRVDPVTGAQTTVSAKGLFQNPFERRRRGQRESPGCRRLRLGSRWRDPGSPRHGCSDHAFDQ